MIQTRIKQRFDALSNWLSNNIVLLKGEIAIVDCGNQQTRFKVGDGSKTFSQLPFVDKYIIAESISQGINAHSVPYGLAAGVYLSANANFSQAFGYASETLSSDSYSFAWNGDDTRTIGDNYQSHGKGSFSINPLSGLSGMFIGEQSLAELLDEKGGNKITIDDRISGVCRQSDLSVVKLGADEYASLLTSNSLLSNALYVVQDNHMDAYGQQLKNLAAPTDLSDAATKEYVDDAVSGIQIPADLSAFTNSPGYLVLNDISDYYKKSETSSAAEISNALSAKADLSSVEHIVQYEEDVDGNYTAVTIGSRLDDYDVGERSFVQGTDCAADSEESHAEGYKTVACEEAAHAEGYETSATWYWSHAEGCATLASNYSAHAEGSYTSAFGDTSHAEGYGTITDNEGAHAEGGYTSAFGYYSHTEGGWTSTGANAIGAHAEGGFTRADGPVSHVEGVKATSEISDYQSFVWQGTDIMPNDPTDITPSTWDEYKAHGPGTFNINPVNGISGFYVGDKSIASVLNENNAQILESIDELSNVYQEKGDYLTSVPNAYSTYDTTVSSLSNEGYIMSSDLTSTLGSIAISAFSEISSPGASVRSIQQTLIQILSILQQGSAKNV